VFQERMLKRIFGPNRDEVTGGLRKLHNEELYKLYSSQRVIIMIKTRRTRCEGHVACMGRRLICVGFWSESQNEGDN
jgi:hypothetical protein